ncbi:MAG: type 4a pilus biogenesis protein PilO [Microbacteriaceae bacterium]|nr:type 4a pilus biogenesis protein PilO [Cryobacterium sp.]MCC6376852.1 type 4a pilus biogenesis protein PilO [Microbacteriaceae bacterium]
MNSKAWLAVAALVSVLVLVLGWFLGLSPKLAEISDANQQRETVEAGNLRQEARLAQLKKEFANIDELKEQLAEVQLGLPPGDDLPTFLGQLHQLETQSGTKLTKFTASDGQKYIPAPGSKTNPAVTADNFVAITIQLTVIGTRDQVIAFVNDLQNGNRLFLVTKLSIQNEGQSSGSTEEGESTADYTGNITGYVYVLVDPSAPPPTSTPVGSLDVQPSPTPVPNQ